MGDRFMPHRCCICTPCTVLMAMGFGCVHIRLNIGHCTSSIRLTMMAIEEHSRSNLQDEYQPHHLTNLHQFVKTPLHLKVGGSMTPTSESCPCGIINISLPARPSYMLLQGVRESDDQRKASF